jgi:hypothetical protein
MAKAARGLPDNFALDLPDDKPVVIGDFLDEELALPASRAPARAHPSAPERLLRPELVRRERVEEGGNEAAMGAASRPVLRTSQASSVIRYQLNLSPGSKKMLEELVEHVCTYSPESDARTSEVFQGIITLLHDAMDELELSELPRRGAWGSVTAKNFPIALSEAFERAILRAARKRGPLQA